ncbi:MAG: hypothetical protein HYX78_05940 [Armatimonadetes bacterium]|nr:hypothetical protein [Armatimonadota bacterium]
MNNHLIRVLKAVGKSTHVLQAPDGSEILVLPYGGRVLGLFAPKDETNFLWTNPALGSVETARAFYQSKDWHNSGGDRTWLSPELDFFFPNFPPVVKEYWQPRQLDPGDYQVEKKGEALEMLNRLTLRASRSGFSIELAMTKTIYSAPDPLRYEHAIVRTTGIQYAGYSLRTALEIVNASDSSVSVSIWNLLQMPNGGDLLVPTFSRTDPKIYFGVVEAEDISAGDHLVRYRMRAAGGQKIGLRAADTPGRVGYFYECPNGEWALVIRNFYINPSGDYVDAPWDEADDLGYCIQACNVNVDQWSFSELEYHAPAVGAETGRLRYNDESQVWAYRGPREAVMEVAHILLSSEV